ncbi:MAG: YihY/virulence factor BrkB family protein [Planctomycetota bacterium]|nr:YihY/virulence factor BrkB family protein [Planctomycetota bacterium]
MAALQTAVVASSKHWIRNFFPNLRDAGIRWNEDDASSLAASVAYYLALSLFPMMLLLTSVFGLFLQFSNTGKKAEQQILDIVETFGSPVIEKQIEQVLTQLQNQSLVSGPFGFLAATIAAIGIFAQIDRGFDKIFRIPAPKNATVQRTIFRVVKSRFLAFLMLVGLGGMILVLFTASLLIAQIRSLTNSTLPSMQHVFSIFELCFAVIANGTLFSFVYRWLPKKEVYWIDAIRGGLLAACIWELGREVLGVFFIGMRYTSAYGAIGSFIAILLWCYYGISILFFGAEYVQVLQLRRHGRSTTGAELSLNKSAKSVEPQIDTTEPQIDTKNELSNVSHDEMIESGLREIHAPLLSQPKQRPRRSAEQLY